MESLDNRAFAYAKVIASVFNVKKFSGEINRMTAGARVISYWIDLHNPMDLKDILSISENIALACRVKNVISFRKLGNVIFQLQLPEKYWINYERNRHVSGLEIGLTDSKSPVKFSFDPPHHLVAAATNEGKSYTVKAMMLGLIETYSPKDLQIVVADKHNDFEDFKNESHLVNFDWGTNATKFSEIKNSISWVYQELVNRIENDIKNDSIIVLIIDEVESLIRQDGGKSGEIASMLATITEEARKFGIYVIVTSKKPTQNNLPGIIHNLGNRWIGKINLDYSTTSNILQQPGINLSQLVGKGDFFHVDDKEIERFLVASIPKNSFDKLNRIDKKPISFQKKDKNFTVKSDNRGRPSIQINPFILAFYAHKGPDSISHSMANDLGWSRTQHELHKEAAYCLLFAKNKLKGNQQIARKFYDLVKSSQKGKEWLKEVEV